MRNLLFLIAAALGALLPSCTPADRVVENPLIETANTRTLDIVKVELSDTATVLHVNAYYRPKNWIVISSDSYLQIPARRFMLTGAEGITPDSLFWMPKSGRASFVLRFPPLPRGTKSFDFIESDCDDCFKLYGVDLTGKTEYPEFPEGLPRELRKAPKDGPVPDPIFAVGETRVNIHLLGFREGMYKDMTLYINSMLTGHERKDAPIDPETGVATFKFGQYGPSLIYGNPAGPGSMHLNFWTAPGETADIYVDLTEKGKSIVQRRGKTILDLARRLVGKGDGQHRPWRAFALRKTFEIVSERLAASFFRRTAGLGKVVRHFTRLGRGLAGQPIAQNMYDALHKHGRLAAPCAGENQQRPLDRADRLALHVVQFPVISVKKRFFLRVIFFRLQ